MVVLNLFLCISIKENNFSFPHLFLLMGTNLEEGIAINQRLHEYQNWSLVKTRIVMLTVFDSKYTDFIWDFSNNLYLHLKKKGLHAYILEGWWPLLMWDIKEKIVGSAEQLKNEIMLSIRFSCHPHGNLSTYWRNLMIHMHIQYYI